MAENKTSKSEETKAKKDSKKADKKKSNKKNFFETIARFFKGVNAERKKVVWPTAKETVKNSIIVLVVVIIVGLAIYAVDTGLSLGMKGLRTLKDKAETTTSAETTTASSEDALNALLEGADSENADSTDEAADDTAEETTTAADEAE